MNNDKPQYRCEDTDTGEKIYFDKLDAGVLAWVYLHYVTMDSVVLLTRWNPLLHDYLMFRHDEREYELFNLLIHSMYELGCMTWG